MTNGTIFYPLTPYHLLLSAAIRLDFGEKFNVIILDTKLLNEAVILKIKSLCIWDSVIVIESESKFKRIRSLVSLYFTLVKNKESKVVYFSPGNAICNFMVNKLALRNKVILGEDGLAPYQFESFEKGYNAEINILKRRNKPTSNLIFKQIVKFAGTKVDWKPENIKEILLTNVEMSQIKECGTLIRQINSFAVNRAQVLDEVSKYYENICPVITKKYDVVFFHSENLAEDLRSIDKLLKINGSLRIFHKMRVKRKNNELEIEGTLSAIGNVDTDYSTPWEILYFRNQDSFSNATLVANYLTTAFLDTFELSEEILYRVIIKNDMEEVQCDESADRLFDFIKKKCTTMPAVPLGLS